jgi:predicted RNA-binding protein (virulence factor B family)
VASKNTIPYQLSDQTFGLWLKDDEARIVPLNTDTEENIIATTKQAKELYELCQTKKD